MDEKILFWLQHSSNSGFFEDITIQDASKTDKTDGYLGDIIFVSIVNNSTQKTHHLVLKCSKQGEAFRQKVPTQETFLNEIGFYEKIVPYLMQFQRSKGITDDKVFNSIPKYLGKYISKNNDLEVFILENMTKTYGYKMENPQKPLTRFKICKIMDEYGKLHAISAAIRDQKPEIFQKLTTSTFIDVWTKFKNQTGSISLFSTNIEKSFDPLESRLSESSMQVWKRVKDQVDHVLSDIGVDQRPFCTILHGDSWNNNFLFKSSGETLDVAMLDFQFARVASPIMDLSNFIFCCISEKDLTKVSLDKILQRYYDSFASTLRLLGSNPLKIYPVAQFFEDWRMFSRFGMIMATTMVKLAYTEANEIDVESDAAKGKKLSDSMTEDIRNQAEYVDRLEYLVKYCVDNGLLV